MGSIFEKNINEIFDYTYSNTSIRVPSKVGVEVGKILYTGLFREEYENRKTAFNFSNSEIDLIRNFNNEYIKKISADFKKSFTMMNKKLNLYSEKVKFDDKELVYILSFLNKIIFSNKDYDLFGDALEIFRSKWSKQEGGQFFTNQTVTSLALELIQYDPLKGDDLVDICAGTGGFLLSGFHKIWKDVNKKKITLKQITLLAKKSLKGIEIDKDVSEVGNNTLSARLGSKEHKLISCFNSLDNNLIINSKNIKYNNHQCLATNPPFGAKIQVRDINMLKSFELSRMKGKSINSISISKKNSSKSPDILFVEQNIKLLKPGEGRLAIVMPYQLVSGPEATYLRYWILKECSLLAVIDLPGETFQPHTGTKTSLVVLKRRKKVLSNLKSNNDKSVFMSTPRWIGHDRRGNSMFERTTDGKISNKILTDFPDVEEDFKNFRNNKKIKNTKISQEIDSIEIFKDEYLRFNAMFYRQKNQANNFKTSKNKFQIVKLEILIKKIFYPGRFKRNYVDYYKGAVPFLGGSNVTELITKTNKWIREDDPNIDQLRVREGWILVTRSGSTGIVSSVPRAWDGFAISEHVIRIIPDEKILPKEYIIAFLKSKLGQLELSKGIFGSVIEEISPKSISEINLLIPKDKKILNKIVKEIKESEKSRNLSMQSNVNAMNEIENFFSN
jgi:type I restriction-modification system DNA methylase subunit